MHQHAIKTFALLPLITVIALTPHASGSSFFSTTCNHTSSCTQVHQNSICSKVFQNAINQTDWGRCECPQNWTKDQLHCWFSSSLGALCQPGISRCTAVHSSCSFDRDNSGLKRCLCSTGYIMNNGSCARILSMYDNVNCTACERNEGICFEVDDVVNNTISNAVSNRTSTTGCSCPVSRSGPECSKVHVNVTCQVSTFTMTICYSPHQEVDNSSILSTFGNLNDPACKAVKLLEQVDNCEAGSLRLVLHLKGSQRTRCGVTELMSASRTLKYESKLMVQGSRSKIVFNTYCSFLTQTDMTFNGVGVVGKAGNDRGEHKNPAIELLVLTEFGTRVQSSLRLGDKIHFRINLIDDGTYASASVMSCAASSSATLSSRNSISVQLVNGGCAVPGQDIITDVNNWSVLNNTRGFTLQTGDIAMFALGEGNTVFFHCGVKLCLLGSEADCLQHDCSSSRRRKRRRVTSGSREEVVLTSKLVWHKDETDKKLSPGLVILVCISVSVLVGVSLLLLTRRAWLRSPGDESERLGTKLEMNIHRTIERL